MSHCNSILTESKHLYAFCDILHWNERRRGMLIDKFWELFGYAHDHTLISETNKMGSKPLDICPREMFNDITIFEYCGVWNSANVVLLDE